MTLDERSTPHGWRVFDTDPPLLTYEYSFGPGTSTALAVGGAEGLIVVSPPCRVGADVLDDLAPYGPVRALVASNAYHHLGIPTWKRRFPDADVFAPAQAVALVSRKTRLKDIRPLADARAIAGAGVELVDMPHYKTGEALVRVRARRGMVWYVTDIVLNFTRMPVHPIARLAFSLSGSGPGLRYNNIAPIFMVTNKRALRRWFDHEFRQAPADYLIPAHGDVVDFKAQPDAYRSLFGHA